MATSAKDLHDRIDEHLDDLGAPEELNDSHYHAAHERFESSSNQRTLILDWLEDLAHRTDFPVDRETRVLSVGCGGGVMDRRIAKIFSDHVDRLTLTGVDPNPEHTRAFERGFANAGIEVEAFTGMFEDYASDHRFDVIHFVHCLYYFEHIEPELNKAFEMLAPGGVLVVLQAPNEALNHLADRVWKKQFDQAAWYSDDVRAALSGLDIPYRVHRIEAEVDVTDCFDPASDHGTEVLDFIVQADTTRFSAAFQQSVRDSLRAVCRRQGRRVLCAHPVDAIVARRPA